jgi:hypothetical protein
MRINDMLRYFAVVCMLFCICALSGCNTDSTIATDKVAGVVTLDGTPIGGAGVRFTPANENSGRPAFGTSADNGIYTLTVLGGKPGEGTLPGDYIVTVDKVVEESTGRQEPDPNEPGQMREQKVAKDLLPLKYKSAVSSPLKVTVVPGVNEINLELESK